MTDEELFAHIQEYLDVQGIAAVAGDSVLITMSGPNEAGDVRLLSASELWGRLKRARWFLTGKKPSSSKRVARALRAIDDGD